MGMDDESTVIIEHLLDRNSNVLRIKIKTDRMNRVPHHHVSPTRSSNIDSEGRREVRRPRCLRLWLRYIIAVTFLAALAIASFHEANKHHMNDLDEQRQDLFLDIIVSRATHQHGEERSWSPFKFAIAYVIGGCLPEDPSYRYYFYNILISHDNMRQDGSKADVVVFVQMSFKSAFEVLPDEDMRIFVSRGIKVTYIAKNEHESFYSLMLDKFRVLSLTQYDRVLFSDGDVLVRGSLDYLYELSMAGVLKENLIIVGRSEPANGGFFMLKPSDNAVERIRNIIRDKEARCAHLEYPYFDRKVGWGHVFEGTDYYEFISHRKASGWEFHGDFADQGLLYQWVKYEEKSVSMVFKDGIQNWGINASTGELVLETFNRLNVLNAFSNRGNRLCIKSHLPCQSPYTEFIHFTGTSKPWLRGPHADWKTNEDSSSMWFKELDRLNEELGLGLNFSNWRTGHQPLLGLFPLQISATTANYSSVVW
jgi:hypothetical protein